MGIWRGIANIKRLLDWIEQGAGKGI